LDSDNRGLTTSAHALHRNEGSARIEIDFRPVADYDQPWDKINHFDSKTGNINLSCKLVLFIYLLKKHSL